MEQSKSINPLRPMKDEPDFLLAMLGLLAGGDVDEATQAKAKDVMNCMGQDHDELTMLDLVGGFDKVPELQVFASKLRAAAFSGQYGQLFSGIPDVAGMPATFDEYRKLGPDPAVAKSHKLYQEFCAEREARNKTA